MNKKFSVLLIEDEEHIRTIVEYNLQMDGIEVYLAEDGPTGLDIATTKKPDVILLDWMLPGMEGCKCSKSSRPTKRPRVYQCLC